MDSQEERIKALEDSIAYLLSEFSGERFEEMDKDINYLLSEVEGKSKLVKLIEILRKDNEELFLQRGQLMREKAVLSEALASEKHLTKRMKLLIDSQEKNSTLFSRLNKISDLSNKIDSLIDTLVSDFRID